MATATANGSLRIIMQDASGTRRDVVFGEVRSEALNPAGKGNNASTDTTDPRQMLQVPAGQSVIGQDDKLTLEYKADSASTVDNTGQLRVPVRIQNIKTKVVRETYLTYADFGITSTDISVATSFTVLGSYTVNAQEQLKLGHATQVNSQIYANFQWT